MPTNRSDDPGDPAEPTTAFPSMRSEGSDSDAATEKLNSPGPPENGDARQRRRSAGGLSAQDLLRREGRL
ncbi:MmpL protein [Mycobacterium paraseoulense]|uniref:MmpL protein n=1 Tax=Mycobacterium paraseoulense TaxID=590652 RepID=A0A1X0I2E6_9MYCO|nr:MmpL protein [Mycobacterium paraseoulense]